MEQTCQRSISDQYLTVEENQNSLTLRCKSVASLCDFHVVCMPLSLMEGDLPSDHGQMLGLDGCHK